jgi:hypothetical protein
MLGIFIKLNSLKKDKQWWEEYNNFRNEQQIKKNK